MGWSSTLTDNESPRSPSKLAASRTRELPSLLFIMRALLIMMMSSSPWVLELNEIVSGSGIESNLTFILTELSVIEVNTMSELGILNWDPSSSFINTHVGSG